MDEEEDEEHHDEAVDMDEQRHFREVCQSYQQYATFHQARQRGVDLRVQRLLHHVHANSTAGDNDVAAAAGPTIASAMPPSLLPHTPEHRKAQKQFCDATIRNQFFLDNVLQYSGAMTSQEVRRHRGAESERGAAATWATEDQISKVGMS